MVPKIVMFVLPNLNGGGAERVTINFIRQLSPNTYDIKLVVFDKTNDLLSLLPLHVELIDLKTRKASLSLFGLYMTVNSLKPDVVYCSHSRVATLLAVIKILNKNFQLVSRVPSMPSLERQQAYTKLIFAKLYAWAFRRADNVLAQTSEMKEDVATSYGVINEKITVACNPLDKGYIRDKLNGVYSPFVSGTLNVVASGRHSKEKGFDILLHAFAKVIKDKPDIKLTIIGREDTQTSELRELIKKYSLEQSVALVGFCDNPYLYYQYCDVFVLSSRREGYPNALLENYYLNTPLVATRCVPVVSRLVKDKLNGFTVSSEPHSMILAEAIVKAIGLKRGEIRNYPVDIFDFNRYLQRLHRD